MKPTILPVFIFVMLTLAYGINAQNFGVGTANPTSKLQVNGSISFPSKNETATSFSVTNTDFAISWNGTADGVATLPASISGTGNFKGRINIIKNSTANRFLKILPSGTEKIDGKDSVILGPECQAILQNTGATTGTTWEVLSFSCSATPQVPVFIGRLIAQQNIPANASSPTPVPGITDLTDNGNLYDNTNQEYTCIRSGLYEISMTITLSWTGTVPTNFRYVFGLISVNGGEVAIDASTIGAGKWLARANQYSFGSGDIITYTTILNARLIKGNKYKFGVANAFNSTTMIAHAVTTGSTGTGAGTHFVIKHIADQ